MSALPPKADIRQRDCDVCFVPKADIPHCGKKRRYFSPPAVERGPIPKEGLKIKDSYSPK